MVGGHNGGDFEHISLLLFDLDHFKEVNDNYGHDVGDKVLKKVGSSILDMIRQTDVAIRFGGEEIMVFVANSIENGYSLAERIRKEIESTVFQSDNMDFSVTLGA